MYSYHEQINRTTALVKDKDRDRDRDNGEKVNGSVVGLGYVQRVAWVVDTRDYTLLTEKEIQDQYARLRKELHGMNLEVERAVEKIDFKLVKKSKVSEPDPTHTLEIRDKEVENNNAIIDRLRKQLFQLQKKSTTLTSSSKTTLQSQIQQTKQALQSHKSKIKQLKSLNKSIGTSILNSDQIYEQIKRLENEKEVQERKKAKLQERTDRVYEQISASQIKLEQIQDGFEIAEGFFGELGEKEYIGGQQRELQLKYQHAKHCLQVVTRKNQSSNNTKQQKYHILLKTYESQTNKLNTLQQKTASLDLQIIHCKKLIQQLQEIYKQNQTKRQILNQEPVFFTEFQECGDRSDRNDKNQAGNQRNLGNLGSQRVRTQNNKENLGDRKEVRTIQDKRNEKSKSKQRQRLQTSNGIDPAEQQDIILQLDQKFKSKPKQNLRSSHYQKQTQIDEDLPQDIIDEDEQISDFKTKISEEKVKRKSREGFNIAKDLDKIKNQIDRFDFMRANQDSYD